MQMFIFRDKGLFIWVVFSLFLIEQWIASPVITEYHANCIFEFSAYLITCQSVMQITDKCTRKKSFVAAKSSKAT